MTESVAQAIVDQITVLRLMRRRLHLQDQESIPEAVQGPIAHVKPTTKEGPTRVPGVIHGLVKCRTVVVTAPVLVPAHPEGTSPDTPTPAPDPTAQEESTMGIVTDAENSIAAILEVLCLLDVDTLEVVKILNQAGVWEYLDSASIQLSSSFIT